MYYKLGARPGETRAAAGEAPWVDLRSDTVTRPGEGMREAMMSAAVGDDVYGEDPTVNALQERLAGELGFEAGLFVPSGTQSNLVALMSHCERGDEYIVGADAHTYKFEGGGAAVLGSIQPQPVPNEQDGTLDLGAVERAIKPVDPHFARTRILALENTWQGRPLPLSYLAAARQFAERRGLALHLDGARLYNAAFACRVHAKAVASYFDSVSVCFSKGLGAPVGSVLVGSAELIERARRWRKVAGGGWRQAGMLAAACLYALDHNIDRLGEDHERARRLAQGITGLPGLEVRGQHTNMVFIEVPRERLAAFRTHLVERRIRMSIGYLPQIRMVTHLEVGDAEIEQTVEAFRSFFGG